MEGARLLALRGRDSCLERVAEGLAERWSDKTMSVLKSQQLTACEERLLKCPGTGIFEGPDDWRDLFAVSYYAEENIKKIDLTALETLRARVLSCLPIEAALLSEGEESLVQRLMFSDGETQLISWEEMTFAEALVRRLWCTVSLSEDHDTVTLKLQPALLEPLSGAMGTEEYASAREKLFALDATLHGLLYLTGFLYANVPVSHFMRDILKREDETTRLMLLRSLRAAYDFTFDAQGDMLLLHPGLADPEKLLRGLHLSDIPEPVVTQEMLLGGMNGMLTEEKPSCEMLGGALSGALRPEYTVEDAVEDLKIMVKQGAPFSELREVMVNMLVVLPTDRMLAALRLLYMETVRWTGVPAAVLN